MIWPCAGATQAAGTTLGPVGGVCLVGAAWSALNALRQFPQGTGFGGQLADPALGGGGLARQAAFGSTRRCASMLTISPRSCAIAACASASTLCSVVMVGFVLAGDGKRFAAAALLGLVSRRQRAGDNAGAHGARLDAPLGEGGGDDRATSKASAGCERAAALSAATCCCSDAKTLARGRGRGFGFFAAAAGFDKAGVEGAHVALGSVGLRAQPFGALRFRAAIAIGLCSRALGLGVRRP